MTSPAATLESELTQCLKELGLKKNDNVYTTGNIGALGRVRLDKSLKQDAIYNAFKNNIGDQGTIFSPAASMNLCNTDIPFDIENTPSHSMGSFAEYIRTLPNAVRSFHPFWSIAGVGVEAKRLDRVSRHSYGVGSPWSHFMSLDVTQVNMGLHPSRAVTLIHYIETTFGVPYRYTKEFNHPILKNGQIQNELFYQSVFYRDTDTKKRLKLNEHYFELLKIKGLLNTVTHSSGLKFWSFKMKDFYDIALEFFIDDIYNYLEDQPSVKPYSL
jgi:aminoglycoside 3-N-acetyltransferase